MSSILSRIMTVVLLLAVIVVTIGYVLPRDYRIESTVTIDAPAESVFPMINNLPNWQTWSTWNEEQVDSLRIQYGDAKAGVGAIQTWTDARGSGKLWITESESPTSIEYRMKFGNFPEMSSRMELTPVPQGSVLKWSSRGRLPDGPFYGYAALLFPRQMTHQNDLSLQRLKSLCEGSSR